VVTSEVKQLAAQAAKATGEIAVQIGGMQQATQESASAIEGIARIINEIGAITTTISEAVDRQGLVASAIARNIQEATSGTAEASASIGHVSDTARKTGDTTGGVLFAAGDLARGSNQLRGQVREFLQQVVQRVARSGDSSWPAAIVRAGLDPAILKITLSRRPMRHLIPINHGALFIDHSG
jgi:methyl-accepting chemotaxis protein